MIKRARVGGTYPLELLKRGYAICISNRTDPFSRTNYKETLALLQTMVSAKLENGIFFQTKGGEGVDEALKILEGRKNLLFYITITCGSDEKSKIVEPGAPVTSERIALAKKLKGLGHSVIIAINPCVEEWMSEQQLASLVAEVSEVGIRHFIFQRLHMTRKDVSTFSKDRLGRFEGSILEETVDQKAVIKRQVYLQRQVNLLRAQGVEALAFGMPYSTNFFKEVRQTLGRVFPSNYDFFNYCFDSIVKGTVTFDDYVEVMTGGDKEFWNREFKGLSTYIMRVARQVWKGNEEVQGVKTLTDVLRVYWNEKRIHGSPQNNFLLSNVQRGGENVVDGNGNIVLYFDGSFQRKRAIEL
jgi:DNA repair photolyase